MLSFTGTRNITVAYNDIYPWESSSDFLPPGHRMGINLRCASPLTIEDLRAGNEAFLFYDVTMAGGVGGSIFLVGSATFANHEVVSIKNPLVRVYIGSFGYQLGRVTIQAPTTSQECLLDPVTFAPGCSLHGGAGKYDVELTRAAAYFDAFWGLIAGMAPIESLEQIDVEAAAP